ncbi:MAG: hypothetical protein ABSF17_09765 [Terracidiphilus sp.]|jgi:hypothetical protein
MKIFGHELVGFPKVLAVLVVVLLVASGLCGLQFVASSGGNGSLEGILIPLGILELIAMALSAAGIVVVLVMWGLHALFDRFAEGSELDARKPFNDKDGTKHDEER